VIGFGGIYPIAFDVLDATGVLTHAATATLTITLPDGTTASPAITDTAVPGQYRLAYQTTMAGRHTAHATTTGPGTVYDDEWDVGETPWMAIVSLTDARAQLNMDPDDTSSDGLLRDYVAGVTGAIEQYLHEKIVRQSVTDEIETCRARSFRLWSSPVISLTSVTSWDGSVTWDVSQMRVNSAGVVRVMAGPPVTGLVDATYLAGYQVVPPNYRRGALVMLEHVWESQRGQGTIMSGVIGPEEHYRAPGEFFTLPNKSKEWLGPPRPVVA
jgi:hypothetical protein